MEGKVEVNGKHNNRKMCYVACGRAEVGWGEYQKQTQKQKNKNNNNKK